MMTLKRPMFIDQVGAIFVFWSFDKKRPVKKKLKLAKKFFKE